MKALTAQEAREWCKTADLIADDYRMRYSGRKAHKFFLTAPAEHREIVALVRQVLYAGGGISFVGGLLWLRRWDIGSPQFVWPGWFILESIRKASGELQSLEIAPAQAFRDDERVQLHAFLIQTVAYGWVADAILGGGSFFLHFKDNRQICFTAKSADVLNELRAAVERWNPTDQDPFLAKLALSERRHKR